MEIKFWGVRGSTPAPQPENMRYGGNTSCVEVRLDGTLLVFDCGTGFRNLGKHWAAEFAEQPIQAHIFLSHFHWDHIQGIPFFAPLYDGPENRFAFHGANRAAHLKDLVEAQMFPPYFPVEMATMPASRSFHEVAEGRFALEGCTVQANWLNHPQGCLGFRLETNEGTLVYATDNEPGDELFDKQLRKLAEGVDILIYDAQYLPEEYQARRRGWGHSHWREGINVATESGARELVLFHHDPDHTDACIDHIVREARNYYPAVRAASEGMVITLNRSTAVGNAGRR